MGIALACVLCALLGAHVVLVVGLARRGARGRALLALFVAPLAPWWGWSAGLRPAVMVWAAALGLYVLGIAIA